VGGRLGEIAALSTALCWVFTALFFAAAGARIGSLVVNFVRLVMALAVFMLGSWVMHGHPLPLDFGVHAWVWLSISGLVGFTFGDLCLFRAFVVIGPRLSALIMSMAPPLTALLGWVVLGETLRWMDVLGMTLTITGIAWAVTDRAPPGAAGAPEVSSLPTRTLVIGVLLAMGGALGQAGGLVLSKHGMGDHDAFAATQIRVIAGSIGFAALFVVTRWWTNVFRGLRDGRALWLTAGGALFGPFLGVWLSLIAVQHTATGVAASLMATTPILIIPVVVLVRRERVGFGGIAGALLAVSGVVLLFT
jgi:drug/metabolite transporter (DMT)-like permease